MASPLRQRTIVIADGDTSFRTFLSGLLRPRQGVRVLEARGAWDVWPLLDAEEIHLFVVDAQVPESGGVALVEQLRERGVRTPVLFIASNWQNHRTHEQLTHELTVQRVMHKPFSAYQFIMEVESTLEAPEATLSRSIPPPKVGSVPRRLVSEPAMPAAEGPAPISSGRGTTTFVVVGTDAELTDGLRAVAEQSLVTLVFAPDAASAITLIRARPVDGALVLLGADDPDLGFAEATELLCTEVGKGLPTGFVSRHTDVHTRVNAIHAGGLVHLTPPFHVQDLQHAVSAMSQARSEEPALVMLVADRRRGAEIGAVLAAANMKVDGVSDAYTLLEHLGAATPDVLLFDLDLPGVSGLDVCKLLRASPTFCALAVVLLGTHDSSEARIAAFDAGADDFLIKPLGEEELLARVEARVRRHRAVRESADKDPVSGLLQRHAFVDRARAMLAAARRSASAVAFCLLQLSDVPRLRTARGQLAVETLVSTVGRHVTATLREYDLYARWGEDELLLALPDIDASTAPPLLARLGEALAKVRVSDDEGPPLPITVRVGVATHPDDAHAIPSLVRTARRRLRPLSS